MGKLVVKGDGVGYKGFSLGCVYAGHPGVSQLFANKPGSLGTAVGTASKIRPAGTAGCTQLLGGEFLQEGAVPCRQGLRGDVKEMEKMGTRQLC